MDKKVKINEVTNEVEVPIDLTQESIKLICLWYCPLFKFNLVLGLM